MSEENGNGKKIAGIPYCGKGGQIEVINDGLTTYVFKPKENSCPKGYTFCASYKAGFCNEMRKINLNPYKVCYVCGKIGQGYIDVGKGLSKCSSKVCQLKVISEIDRVYVDDSIIPATGITEEWKSSITKAILPFIGKECIPKGKVTIVDSVTPLPKTEKPFKMYAGIEKKIPKPTMISVMVDLMKEKPYTIEELAEKSGAALSTVKTQVLYGLKQNYMVVKVIDEVTKEVKYRVE